MGIHQATGQAKSLRFMVSVSLLIFISIFSTYNRLRSTRGSYLYKANLRHYESIYTQRLRNGHEYLQSVRNRGGFKYEKRENTDICLTVITNGGRDTLPLSIASIVSGLTTDPSYYSQKEIKSVIIDPSISFFVFNALRNKVDKHLQLVMDANVPVIDIEETSHHCVNKKCTTNEKSSLDYLASIEQCEETGAKYMVILEDDIIATSNILAKIRASISELNNKTTDEWLHIKLFLTDFWAGWMESDTLLLIAIFLSSGFIWLSLCIFSFPSIRKFHRKKDKFLLLGVFSIFGGLTILALIIVGKQNTPFAIHNFPRGVNEIEPVTASTLGLVFPTDKAMMLVKHLREVSKQRALIPIDKEIGHFARDNKLRAYVTTPNFVEHTGLKSTYLNKRGGYNTYGKEWMLTYYFKQSSWFEE